METNNITPNKNHNGRMVAGVILLGVGCLLLARHTGFLFIPHWLFSWPMWMIAIGVYIGAQSNFTKPNWIWMVGLGTVFLLTCNLHVAAAFVWPATMIAIGVWMVTRYNYPRRNGQNGPNFTDYSEVK